MGNLSPHFSIEEFVPKLIHNMYGTKSRWFINPVIVEVAEFVRAYFDSPVIINDWMSGGHFNERGYRLPDSITGAKFSQHKLGNAIDVNVKGLTASKVWNIINDNQAEFMKVGLTTMEALEDTPTWCHLDCRNTGLNTLLIVKP